MRNTLIALALAVLLIIGAVSALVGGLRLAWEEVPPPPTAAGPLEVPR